MKTALIQEEPVIAVFCLNDSLASSVSQQIRSAGFEVWIAKPGKTLSGEIYKTLVLCTGLEDVDEIGRMAAAATSLQKPTIVCFPLIAGVDDVHIPNIGSWSFWNEKNSNQLQELVGNLATAQYIFVDGWISDDSTPILSTWQLLCMYISEGWVWQLRNNLSVVLTSQVLEEITTNLGRPTISPSICLSSTPIDSYLASNQVLSLYESYYHAEIVRKPLVAHLVSSRPFLVREKVVVSDSRNPLSQFLHQLPGLKQQNPVLVAFTEKMQVVDEGELPVESTKKIAQKSTATSEPEVVGTTAEPPRDTLDEQEPLKMGEQLERIFSQSRLTQKQSHLQKLQKTEKKVGKTVRRNRLLFVIGSISFGISLAIVVMAALFVVTTKVVEQQFFAQNPQELFNETITRSEKSLFSSIKFLQPQLHLAGKFVDHPLVGESEFITSAVQRVVSAQALLGDQNRLVGQIVDHILGKQTTSLPAVLTEYDRVNKSVYTNLGELQSFLTPGTYRVSDQERWFSDLEQTVEQQRQSSGLMQSLSPILPPLLGLEGQTRIYAVLFLNSSELRPSGGFIQAVAIITVENGQITSYQTYSSYEIDRRIGGAVEPPPEIADVLGETAWYFRDSNWDPHSPTSAERASWFINKGLGISVDGVLTLPTTAFETILDRTGPLSLPQYNESITAKNVQERLNFHAEVELSDQVKNYPSAVLDAFFQRILEGSNQEFINLLSTFPTLFSDGELQLNLTDQSEQAQLQQLRWSGSLVIPVCPGQFAQVNCEVDSLYQVESNVGVNRVNTKVERDIHEDISLQNGQVVHQRTTKLTNTATSTAWPSGQYDVYFRWYIPTDAVFDSISLDGVQVDASLIRSYSDHGLRVIGFRTQVPILQSRAVMLSYRRPIQTTLPFSYFFFDQKQPGTTLDSYQVVVHHPIDQAVVRLAPNALIEGGKLTFEPEVGSHRLTAVQFR